ncbi:MAG: hypothetical protein IJQ78_06650 [Selenomonadaceae bacterium]|nr:hypothetical protein [Selenomonadaceae bacterium]
MMEAKAILLDGKDNTATCTSETHPGDKVHCHGSAAAEVAQGGGFL